MAQHRAEQEQYTWDDLLAAIGKDFGPGSSTMQEPAERGAIRRRLDPLELACPLHFDDEVARRHGYKGIIAPGCCIGSPFGIGPHWSPGEATRFPSPDAHAQARGRMLGYGGAETVPMPKTSADIITGITVEYFAPVYVGDRLTFKGWKLISATVKRTSLGFGAFASYETQVTNQRNELVAKQQQHWFHVSSNPSAPDENKRENQPKTPSTAAGASRRVLPASEPRTDWSEQLHYEDVHEGDELPPLVMNLTVQRLVEEASASRLFGPPHYDTIAAQSQGAPDMYAGNQTIRGWWERLAREYIGLDGKVRRLGPLQLRTFIIPGDNVVTQGTVKKKWQVEGDNLVELEVRSEHQRGIAAAGSILVSLPAYSA